MVPKIAEKLSHGIDFVVFSVSKQNSRGALMQKTVFSQLFQLFKLILCVSSLTLIVACDSSHKPELGKGGGSGGSGGGGNNKLTNLAKWSSSDKYAAIAYSQLAFAIEVLKMAHGKESSQTKACLSMRTEKNGELKKYEIKGAGCKSGEQIQIQKGAFNLILQIKDNEVLSIIMDREPVIGSSPERFKARSQISNTFRNTLDEEDLSLEITKNTTDDTYTILSNWYFSSETENTKTNSLFVNGAMNTLMRATISIKNLSESNEELVLSQFNANLEFISSQIKSNKENRVKNIIEIKSNPEQPLNTVSCGIPQGELLMNQVYSYDNMKETQSFKGNLNAVNKIIYSSVSKTNHNLKNCSTDLKSIFQNINFAIDDFQDQVFKAEAGN